MLPDGSAAPPSADPPCDAVIIRIADQPDTLLTWQQPGQILVDTAPGLLARRAQRELDPHAVYLEQAGDRILAASSPLITSLPATIALQDVACALLPDIDGGRAGDGASDAGAGP